LVLECSLATWFRKVSAPSLRLTRRRLPWWCSPNADTHLCRIYTKGASEIVLDRCRWVRGCVHWRAGLCVHATGSTLFTPSEAHLTAPASLHLLCSYVLGPDGTRRRLREEEKEQLLAEFSQGGQR